MIALWLLGSLRRRRGTTLVVAAGVAALVSLLAAIGSFITASRTTMATRAAAQVAVDWQVSVARDSTVSEVRGIIDAQTGVRVAQDVGFGSTTGLVASTGLPPTTQSTGPGVVLGLPADYARLFPGTIRPLVGRGQGVLVAQQTAANLHVVPGDTLRIGRAGLAEVAMRIDGVVELPTADSLFQVVGAPPGAQPVAPPDNVVLLPLPTWRAVFDPLAAVRPDLVSHQVHVGLDHRTLPADPSAAFTDASSRARHLEAALAGAGLVGDDLAATLDAARADALYAEIIFIVLGIPGLVTAALLTVAAASGSVDRRRRDQSLLRARGASARALAVLAVGEAMLVGLAGGAVGVGAGWLMSRLAYQRSSLVPADHGLVWSLASAGLGLVVAGLAVAWPTMRDTRRLAVGAGHRGVPERQAGNLATLTGGALLAVGALMMWGASRSHYSVVLAPEGVASISVSYWALAGPLLVFGGAAMLLWRGAGVGLHRGASVIAKAASVPFGVLSHAVGASVSRQGRLLARGLALVAVCAAFAMSASVFYATYRHQVGVDAVLTNGADVTVSVPPGSAVGAPDATSVGRVPGVRHVEPLVHRFAYVGADLQDLYGVRPASIAAAGQLQDAYFQGGTAAALLRRLVTEPDAVLVSDETVHDFQLRPGDRLHLRVTRGGGQPVDVSFRYVGVVKEFPTAPRDSFLVANAEYLARQTGSPAAETLLVDVQGKPHAVAERLRRVVGGGATVSDIDTARRVAGSTLTAVDLRGIMAIELGFALVEAVAAAVLLMVLTMAERRSAFAVLAVLGASRRQLSAFLWSGTAIVVGGGLVAGAALGTVMSHLLVRVLTGVFDPPPAHLSVPYAYLVLVAGTVVLGASTAVAVGATRLARLTPERLRET